MPFVCAHSGTAAEQPVVSPVCGDVFERRLIEEYIDQHGTDPVNGLPLRKEQLIPIQGAKTPAPEASRTETAIHTGEKLLIAPTAEAVLISDNQDLSAVLHSATVLHHTDTVSSDRPSVDGSGKGEQHPESDTVLTISRDDPAMEVPAAANMGWKESS